MRTVATPAHVHDVAADGAQGCAAARRGAPSPLRGGTPRRARRGGHHARQHASSAGQPGAGGYLKVLTGPGEPHRAAARTSARGPRPAGRPAARRWWPSRSSPTSTSSTPSRRPASSTSTATTTARGPPLLFGAAYRPQEMLTTQMADRIVAAVRAGRSGPGRGSRRSTSSSAPATTTTTASATSCGGRSTCSTARRSARTAATPAGGRASTTRTRRRTTCTTGTPTARPDGKADDQMRSQFGFPVVPGLLDAARRPFTAHGVKRRWYTCYGNHDGLTQGNFPQSFQLTNIATGPLKITVAAGRGLARRHRAPATSVPSCSPPLSRGRDAPTPPGRSSPAPRRSVSTSRPAASPSVTATPPTTSAQRHGLLHLPGRPHVLGVVLDTVNPNGEANGSLDQGQLAWLDERAARSGPSRSSSSSATTRSAAWTTRSPRSTSPGRGCSVRRSATCCSASATSCSGSTGTPTSTASPPHQRPGGGGFWEVNTASHVDWPAQARLLELVDNRDGTLSVFGTIVDAAAPLAYGGQLGSTTGARVARAGARCQRPAGAGQRPPGQGRGPQRRARGRRTAHAARRPPRAHRRSGRAPSDAARREAGRASSGGDRAPWRGCGAGGRPGRRGPHAACPADDRQRRNA